MRIRIRIQNHDENPWASIYMVLLYGSPHLERHAGCAVHRSQHPVGRAMLSKGTPREDWKMKNTCFAVEANFAKAHCQVYHHSPSRVYHHEPH